MEQTAVVRERLVMSLNPNLQDKGPTTYSTNPASLLRRTLWLVTLATGFYQNISGGKRALLHILFRAQTFDGNMAWVCEGLMLAVPCFSPGLSWDRFICPVTPNRIKLHRKCMTDGLCSNLEPFKGLKVFRFWPFLFYCHSFSSSDLVCLQLICDQWSI